MHWSSTQRNQKPRLLLKLWMTPNSLIRPSQLILLSYGRHQRRSPIPVALDAVVEEEEEEPEVDEDGVGVEAEPEVWAEVELRLLTGTEIEVTVQGMELNDRSFRNMFRSPKDFHVTIYTSLEWFYAKKMPLVRHHQFNWVAQAGRSTGPGCWNYSGNDRLADSLQERQNENRRQRSARFYSPSS